MKLTTSIACLALLAGCLDDAVEPSPGVALKRTTALPAAPAAAEAPPSEEPMEPAPTAPAPQPPPGFSWVEDGVIAGLAHPGAGPLGEARLAWLSAQGVDVLVSLTETPVPPTSVSAHGMTPAHIPVVDFTAPTQEQLDQFVALAQTARDADRPVAVHCAGGMGRTGTFLATWLVAQGMTAEQAIVKIRELRPGSIETASQEAAVATWAQRHPTNAP
ncbi:MAG: hypothetical protein AMXMBFR64_07980 [Myxococcales bacterium]